MNNTCLTCRFFFAMSVGPRCLCLKAPLLYGLGTKPDPDPAVTTCPQWATASRDEAEVLKPIHNQMDYDQWMGK